MKIEVGKTAGFCYGVKRAVESTKQDLYMTKNPLYCLGELVHNKQVIENLEENGLQCIDSIEEAKGTTIIRAHGVEKQVYERAKEKGIEIKDYTCPNVLKIHEIVQPHSENNYYIFLTGSKDHPENIGTISCCGNHFSVIEKKEDVKKEIEKAKKSRCTKWLLISQTTFHLSKFQEIEKLIKEQLKDKYELVVKNTICRATEIRQKETEGIANKVDKMIIIGGKNSSNTQKLFDIAKKICENTVCIETKEELSHSIYDDTDYIGIMAGASTPQESIDEVVHCLNSISKSILV